MADSKLDPNKSYGWTGKILRVNLTDKTVSVSPRRTRSCSPSAL